MERFVEVESRTLLEKCPLKIKNRKKPILPRRLLYFLSSAYIICKKRKYPMSKSEEKIVLDKIQQARNLYLEQKFDRAIEIYRELVELLKDDEKNLPIIQIELGWSYFFNQDNDQAIEMLQTALKSPYLTTQQQFDCIRLIGFAYEMKEDFTRAKEYLLEALDFDLPLSTKRYAQFELGKIYFLEANYIEAEHYLAPLLNIFREEESDYFYALRYYLGFTNFFQKNLKRARDHFEALIRQANDAKHKVLGYFGLAHIHYQEEDYPALIDLSKKIMEENPDFFDKETLAYFLCYGYVHTGDWDAAELFLRELETQFPNGRYASKYPFLRESIEKREVAKGESHQPSAVKNQ